MVNCSEFFLHPIKGGDKMGFSTEKEMVESVKESDYVKNIVESGPI